MNDLPEICDYEGSDYRTDFWEGRGREYEDRVERVALRRLLPSDGKRLLEVGAGFGRLTDEFRAYDEVILLDYSRSQLEYARDQFGDDGFIYVAANIYEMPFVSGLFDTATMIRVLHHMQDPEAALQAIKNTLTPDGTFILEFANKQNIKAIGRWLLNQQDWHPFTDESVEFVDLNYNFHPRYIKRILRDVGFQTGRMLTVSHYRIALLKRLIPVDVLVALDSMAQLTGSLWQLSPSVFVENRVIGGTTAPEGAFWKCPNCASTVIKAVDSGLRCEGCDKLWPLVNGVYDFKRD